MSHIVRCLVFVAAFLTFAPGARAQDHTSWGKVGDWDIAVDPTIGNGCYALVSWTSGATMRIGRNPEKGTFYLLLGNDKWTSLVPDETYEVQIRFDSRPVWDLSASGFQFNPGETVYLYGQSSNMKFIREFQRALRMKVNYRGRTIEDLKLTGSRKAWEAVESCQRDVERNGLPGARDPFAGSGGRKPDGGGAVATGEGDGLHFCNDTSVTQSVSIGYQRGEAWFSEGWWNVEPGDCARTLTSLEKRYYYYRAEVEAGDFEGEDYFFCTSPKVYEIEGDSSCESRGYDREEFREIDTGPTGKSHTVRLTRATGGEFSASAGDSSEGAGLKICNTTEDTQSVSIGYKGDADWVSEGWWNIDPDDCASPALDGRNHRYYYFRAEIDGGDYDGEGYYFCTSPDAYTIVGDTNCTSRGYDREEFSEIDTGGTTGTYELNIVP